jgi:hypothetical protein
MRLRRSLGLALSLASALALVLGAGRTAHATFTLTLSEAGYADQTITFNPSTGVPGQAEVIDYAGSFGGFQIVVEVASSNSNLPDQTPTLTLNNLQLTGANGVTQTLQITVADTGFSTQSTGPGPVDLRSQVSDTQLPTGNEITYQSFLNGVGGDSLSLSSAGGAQGDSTIVAPTNPFTLESITTITVHGASYVQTTGITEVLAPSPSTLGAAAVSAVPLLGLGLWRRRARKV